MSQYNEAELEDSTSGAPDQSRSGPVEGDRQQKSVRQKDDVEGLQPEAEDEEEITVGRGQGFKMPPQEDGPSALAPNEASKSGKKKSRKAPRGAASALEYEAQYDEGSSGVQVDYSAGAAGFAQSQQYEGRRDNHGDADDEGDYPAAAAGENRAEREGEDPMQRRKRNRQKKRASRRQEMPEEGAYPDSIVHENPEAQERQDEENMFMDESAFEKTAARYTGSVDAKNQISGCLFGFLGLIVLGFASWLIHAGSISQRQEEIVSYVQAVKAWTSTHRSEFEQLSFAVRSAADAGTVTELPLVRGNKTAEWDVRHALGRTKGERSPLRRERYEERLENDFFYRKRPTGGKRRLEDISELSDDELVIDYMPLKYEVTFTPTKESAFFATIYNLDHNKHYASVDFTFSDARSGGAKDQLLQSHQIRLLHKEEKFSKNFEFCKKGNGSRIGAHTCLHYYIPTKICLVADYVETAWQFQPKPCSLQYRQPVADSREYLQEIGFHDYPITLEIRSAHDPHVLFGQRTKGKFILDDSADSQIAAGSILLIFGILMLAMSAYKTYRFCVKYTCRGWLQRRKMAKYLASNQLDPDDLAEVGANRRGARAAAQFN